MLATSPSPSGSLDAAAAGTIRRLTAVLDDIDPVNTTALQRLRDLCEQLHLSQGAIDDACEGKADAAPVSGFRVAVLAFTQRLHKALQGKAPALVLQHHDDVEVICLGLCAFASVKAPSPYSAYPDRMNKARQALDGITSSLLAVVDARRGVDGMAYGQMLNVHNWISRACKARLLTADSISMTAVKSFSAEVLAEFSRRASVWHADAHPSLHLDDHDIGKTAAELKTMLDYGLVSFTGQEDALAQVVAWLSSAPSFALLTAAKNGVGLSSLFSLFKSILDLGVRSAEAVAQPGAASHGSTIEQDRLAPLWKQMIASTGLLDPQKLFNDDGRFLAACANLLRAMHETGLPRGWNVEQRLAFTNAGRRVLDMVGGADPARMAGIALPTLSNLVSFIKAWHKHELMHELKGANKPAASEHPATEAPHQRTAHYAETRNRLKRAAEQVTSALLPDKLARLDRNDTVGALFKGLFSLRQARLLTPALVDPLLVVLASAVANIPNWPTNHAIDIAKGLNTLFSDKVFEWHALQPAFHALMGQPAHGESWSASDVAAFVRGSKVESRQTLSLPLERHVKPASGVQHKPLRTHVVGDRPLLTQPVATPVSDTSLSLTMPPKHRPSGMPRYVKRDADGFIEPSRVSKVTAANPDARTSQLALATGREVEDEEEDEDEKAMVQGAQSHTSRTAARTATTAPPASKSTVTPVVFPGNNKSARKAKTMVTADIDFAEQKSLLPIRGSRAFEAWLPPIRGSRPFKAWLPPANTSVEQHAMARKVFAAIERRNENKALEWLAKSDNENLAGYRAISSDSILSLAIFSSMPKLALAILGTSVGRRCAAEPNKLGVTPLHLAVRLGNMVLLEALLRIEEVVRNINYKGNDGYDAVGAALVLGRTEVLTRLMQLDAVREQLPQAGYNKGNSALSMALAHDRMDALKVLLSHPELARQAATEQSIEIPAGHGYGPVTLAQYFAHLGDLTTLSVLTAVDRVLEHEAAIVKPFNLAGLALHSGSREVFNHVLACPQLQPLAGLLTVSGCTPLMLAVWSNNDELFAKLLAISAVRATVLSSPGARLRIMTQWPPSLPPQTLPYKDVLDLAVQGGNHGMASSLLQVQEVLDAVDKRGDYAQGLLLRCMDHRMPDLVLALLQRPLVAKVVRIPDSSGMTALHHAAKLGQTRIVETLLRMLPASEIARSNREDKSAFLIAKEAGHQETARVLAAAMAAADANAALNQ